MKHDWDYSDYGRQPTDMQIHNRRICRNCGKEQKKFSNQVWGRVVGYSWEPLVGRCKGKIQMIPDGRQYLVQVKYENGLIEWEIVQWTEPNGLSDANGTPNWCNVAGFSLRNPVFLKFCELEKIIETMQL